MSFPVMPSLYFNTLRNRATELISELVSSDFVRQVIATFSTRILLILLGLATTIIVTRILGPEGRGLYAVAIAIGAIGVQLGNLGVHTSNNYCVSQDRSQLPVLLANSLVISLIIGGFGIMVPWWAFSIWPNMAPVTGNLLLMALIGVPLGLAYLLLQNLLLGIQDIKSWNLIEIVSKTLSVILIASIILMNSVTVESVFATSLAALLIGLVLAILKLKRHFACFPKPSVSLFKSNLHYSFKAYLAAFFVYIVLKVDLLIVHYMLGAEQAGYYSIAVSLAEMVYMLPVIIGTILFPKLAALKDPNQKWMMARKSIVFVFVSMTVFTLVIALASKSIIVILFGDGFLPSVAPFVWLMPAILLISVNTIYMNYFGSLGIGMPSIVVFSPAISSIVNILLNFKLIPVFGIIGASISSLIAYSMMLLFSLVYQYHRRISFSAFLNKNKREREREPSERQTPRKK